VAATRISGLVAAAALVALNGCGGGDSPRAQERHDMRAYVAQIEPLRLGVNKLLDGADPILASYRRGEIGAAQAQGELRTLEHRFADYMRRVAAVKPVPPDMVAAQRAYAGTYVDEDAYLRALIHALPSRDWSTLPDSEASQRKALVAWRAKLAIQAARLDVALPDDIEITGRDEVVPSPLGEDD
jgi:hypothetical protein